MKTFAGKFWNDTRGNFATMFAVASMGLLMSVGAAVDYATLSNVKYKLQNAADASALAGAIVANAQLSGRIDTARTAFDQNLLTAGDGLEAHGPSIGFNDAAQEVTVIGRADVKLFVMGFINSSSSKVEVRSTVNYGVDNIKPVAVAFVLDVSGSMNDVLSGSTWITKVDLLKTASELLFDEVEAGVGVKSSVDKVMRASVSSYNGLLLPNWTSPMRGERAKMDGVYAPAGLTTRGLIRTLTANGGTNSTPAIQDAYNQLMLEKARSPNSKLIMMVMTDGNNNDALENDASKLLCKQAKDDGVLIYAVALDAPANGQNLLLACAAGSGAAPASEVAACEASTGAPTQACMDLKKGFYYDTSEAAAFKAAFKAIGEDIGKQVIRIKG
ncbi:MAG: pilus assembly protein TadG-related protein [Robiginitomaculum sp.]